MPVVDTEDFGARGKALERAFARCLKLANMSFEENGLMGRNATLWDFRPKGLKWKGLPDGAYVNLKATASRNLFTSTRFWKKVFIDGAKDDDATLIKKVQRELRAMKFHNIWWLKPRTKEVENVVIKAAQANSVTAAKAVLEEKNWAYYRTGRYTVSIERERGKVTSIKLKKGDKNWVQIRVRVNKNAGNTAGSARTTSGKAMPPFKPVKASEGIVDEITAFLEAI